jgi:hypothetical protein
MRRILAVLLLLPGALDAQPRTTVSAFVAADGGIKGDPLLVGGTLSREVGPLAARLSLGFDVSDPPPAPEDGSGRGVVGIWGNDVDALLFLGNPRRAVALVPYAVAGIGTRGVQHGGRPGISANYSYGAGFRAPLGGGFGMEGELRYREVIGGREGVVSNGIEIRFGMSVGFGASNDNRAPRGAPPARAPLPIRGNSPLVSSAAHMRVAAATLGTAERYVGVPYRWGGNTPQTGFDCSGFIRYVFNQQGITVPRVSRDQARFGTALPLDLRSLEPGDILAFASNGRDVDHTAIYAGGGLIIHSSSSGGGVRYDDLYSRRGEWYVRHMVAARRVIDGGMYFGGG